MDLDFGTNVLMKSWKIFLFDIFWIAHLDYKRELFGDGLEYFLMAREM